MGPLDKVVSMMEGLQNKVIQEGEAEAVTYNKFACFCKDATKEKTDSIKKGTDEKDGLLSSIEELQTTRSTLDDDIEDIESAIEKLEKDIKEAKETRKEGKKLYTANAADLKGAIFAVEGAMKALTASKKPSLIQFQSMAKTIKTAAMLADALGFGASAGNGKLALFLQQAPEIATTDYDFHSQDILDTFDKLLTDFKEKMAEVHQDEQTAESEHAILLQEKTQQVELKEAELARKQKQKERTQADIAEGSQQLTVVAATILDDQEYLKKLAATCHEKAKTSDQRLEARQAELTTLSQVIGIIKGAVGDKVSSKTIRFNQQAVNVRVAQAVARSEGAMEALEADAEATEASDGAPLAFLQLAKRNLRGGPAADGGRTVIANLLKRKGGDLRSTLLTALASRILADPFAKIKELIQELIERLMQEASNEASQKAWCDKAMHESTKKRDRAAVEIEDMNSEMAKLEAFRDKLAEEVEILGKEITELEDERTKAEKIRADEKKENAATVEEAEQGLDALGEAIKVLDRFYKTTAKEKVELSLAQRGPLEDAPETSFETGEAYKGSQNAVDGILGMMDVMKSDFERTMSETEAAEAEAAQEHTEFLFETGKSLATKEEAVKQKNRQKETAEGKLSTLDEDLTSQMTLLESAIKELLELKPTCIDTGMTYEERVARREQEMKALENALCILQAYEKYGPDGLANAC
mmetsp:Transcript_6782/g.20648  ORF Transcript_6782/g.20648 Transcript_6782/m.20648 type:complete len:701 (-) Transcript_6782:102-2204(-)